MVAVLDKRISTNIYGHFELFYYFKQKFALVAGLGRNWENHLFGIVSEAVEVTAVQRGVERWEPDRLVTVPAVTTAPPAALKEAKVPMDAGALCLRDLFLFDPPLSERFVSYVPFYDVAAAAGNFGPDQTSVDPATHCSWIRVKSVKPAPGMFVIRVSGRSMEPRIPDGSYCLFRGGEALAGTREGRIVLVALRDSVDPENGGRLTVKRFLSEKRFGAEGNFHHTRITLMPLNRDFEPIVIQAPEEDTLQVLGEFVKVVS